MENKTITADAIPEIRVHLQKIHKELVFSQIANLKVSKKIVELVRFLDTVEGVETAMTPQDEEEKKQELIDFVAAKEKQITGDLKEFLDSIKEL